MDAVELHGGTVSVKTFILSIDVQIEQMCKYADERRSSLLIINHLHICIFAHLHINKPIAFR